MPEMALDPARGYVALPLDLFDYDLSPGAFRALVEFCRMADAEGSCWPSLAQLSERLGRSRAAISGYVAELREAGLLVTENQRTANGFNYRLRYCLPFWARWKQRFGRRKAERSVQPAERPKETQNQIQKNKESDQKIGKPGKAAAVLALWQNLAATAAYPAFTEAPSPHLLRQTESLCSDHVSEPPSPDIELARTFADLGVEIETAQLAELENLARGLPQQDVDQKLRESWKPYWRRLPSPRQFARLIEGIKRMETDDHVIALLRTYLRRAERAGFSLPNRIRSSTPNMQPAGTDPSYPRI